MNNPKNATYKNSRPSSIMNFTTIHDEPEDDDENEDYDTLVFFFCYKIYFIIQIKLIFIHGSFRI
jgi:hypothetical protein